MKHFLLLLLIGFFSTMHSLLAQTADTKWDNTLDRKWPEGFVRVEIRSSSDGRMQRAILFKSPAEAKQPLVVSLHTWSGDYLQEDPLAEEVLSLGWNYIHPDFRGPNKHPEACGSELVISDIEDAIRFALLHLNADPEQVHIIGVSGGGHASLLSLMKLEYPVKSFHAWAPVTNLVNWYWECRGRGLKYSLDLEMVTTGGKGFDEGEAERRSPALMRYPKEKRSNSVVYIYTGIHDGYTGSVPVTHSINMYNNLVKQVYPGEQEKLVSDSLKLELLEKRMNPYPDTVKLLGDRQIHLYRELPQIRLIIFEGGHEMIVPAALAMIPLEK